MGNSLSPMVVLAQFNTSVMINLRRTYTIKPITGAKYFISKSISVIWLSVNHELINK